jgi:3-oxoacyl-[acyl-carrier-protein] synthase-3
MITRLQAAITAVGGFVPNNILDNTSLEKMVDTSDAWITSRTGIKERRIADADMATSDMAALSVKNLLDNSGVNPEDIELLILATSTPDHVLNPAAALVCEKAGLKNAWGFDLNAACSGFLYALSVGASFIESGRHSKVLVVGADKMSAIVNYEDRNTCVLFGDGAGAVLLGPGAEGVGLQDSFLKSDGHGAQFLSVPAGGSAHPATTATIEEKKHFVQQDGRTVFKNAINGMTAACKEILQRNSLSVADIDWIVPHQANMRIIQAIGEHLSVPVEKIKVNINRYGNTTAATLPLCLWDFHKDFKPGDKILLTAFGAGFTWGSSYLVWGSLMN